MSRAQVALAREESRRKLHERIEIFERDEYVREFHRMTPFKIPTVIAAAGSGMTCAGRNSLNRYLRATGFSGLEVETSRETQILFSIMEKEPIMSRSIMQLPVKVPGKEQLAFLLVPVLDENQRQRDFPIKLSEHILPYAVDRTLYPTVIVTKAGLTYDLYPFPSEVGCYDEGQTVIFSKENLLSKKELEQELAKGFVCVAFNKLNGEERSLCGTTHKGFIPKELHEKPNSATGESHQGAKGSKKVGEDQVVLFDVDIQSWRSCKYSSITQLRVRLHPYDTFPGTLANREEYFSHEYFNQCMQVSSGC